MTTVGPFAASAVPIAPPIPPSPWARSSPVMRPARQLPLVKLPPEQLTIEVNQTWPVRAEDLEVHDRVGVGHAACYACRQCRGLGPATSSVAVSGQRVLPLIFVPILVRPPLAASRPRSGLAPRCRAIHGRRRPVLRAAPLRSSPWCSSRTLPLHRRGISHSPPRDISFTEGEAASLRSSPLGTPRTRFTSGPPSITSPTSPEVPGAEQRYRALLRSFRAETGELTGSSLASACKRRSAAP